MPKRVCIILLVLASVVFLSRGAASAVVLEKMIVCPVVSKSPVIDGSLDDPCWKKAGKTTPFKPLGKASATVAGVWEEADKKFRENPTVAKVCCDSKYLYIAVVAKYPKDTPGKSVMTKRDAPIWSEDCVEVFFDTNRDESGFYQIIVNTIGTVCDLAVDVGSGVEDFSWNSEAETAVVQTSSGFTVEMRIPLSSLGVVDISSGESWNVNFAREGPSCGGRSTWAPVGKNFSDPDRFGIMIFGDLKDFYRQEIVALKDTLAKTTGAGDVTALKTRAGKKLELLEAGVGKGAISWKSFQVQSASIASLVKRISQAGRNVLIWNRNIWDSLSPDINIPAETKPLKSLRVYTAKNTRAICGFVISNLSEKVLMGRLLVGGELKNKINLPLKNFTFYRAVYTELENGKMIADALVRLPAMNLVEVPSQTSLLVVVEVDSHGLEPGLYFREISFIPSYSGFKSSKFELDVKVADVDLSVVDLKTWLHVGRANDAADKHVADNLVRLGIRGNFFHPYKRGYPKLDKEGNILQLDFESLDAIIDNTVAAGLPVKKQEIFVFLNWFWSQEYARNLAYHGHGQLKFESEAWKKGFANSIHAIRDHLFKRGFTYDQIYFYPVDEPAGDPSNPKTRAALAMKAADYIHQADPKLKVAVNPYTKNDGGKYYEEYFSKFDMIFPLRSLLTRKADIKKIQAGGKEVRSYAILWKNNSPNLYRKNYWFNARDGFGLPSFWCYDNYSGDPFNSYDFYAYNKNRTADYGIVYIDHDNREILESLRWEAVYQGTEDYRAIELCKKMIRELENQGKDVAGYRKKLNAIVSRTADKSVSMDESRRKIIEMIIEIKSQK